jgi:hypothetical protein
MKMTCSAFPAAGASKALLAGLLEMSGVENVLAAYWRS